MHNIHAWNGGLVIMAKKHVQYTQKELVIISIIDDNRYDVELKEDGVQDILKLGIAFSGKKVSVKMKE